MSKKHDMSCQELLVLEKIIISFKEEKYLSIFHIHTIISEKKS